MKNGGKRNTIMGAEVLTEQKQAEILEKYDSDSKVRKFGSKKITIVVSLFAIVYSLFQLYITFNPLPTLQQRAIHVALGLALIFFFIQRGKTSSPKNCLV